MVQDDQILVFFVLMVAESYEQDTYTWFEWITMSAYCFARIQFNTERYFINSQAAF